MSCTTTSSTVGGSTCCARRPRHRIDDPDDADIVGGLDDPDAALHELVDEHLDLIAFICNRFEPGTVISRSGTLVWSREWPTAA